MSEDKETWRIIHKMQTDYQAVGGAGVSDCLLQNNITLLQMLCNAEAENESLRNTLRGIAEADYRKWEELARPEEFVRWAKSRAQHALANKKETQDDHSNNQ